MVIDTATNTVVGSPIAVGTNPEGVAVTHGTHVLAAWHSYPPISLTVRALGFAPSQVTNTVTVTGGGDATTRTATDATTIVRGGSGWSRGYGDPS